MDRIPTTETKLTKEVHTENKLNFCQSHLGRALLKVLLLTLVIAFSNHVQAEEDGPLGEFVEVKPMDDAEPLVEVKQHYNLNTPYKERRDRFGWIFSIGAENIFMPDYESIIDGQFYEDLFGSSDVTLLQGELGFKYNFKLGSIALSAGFGMGTLTDDRVGEERVLGIQRQFLGFNFYFDNLMKEPYAVPYVGAQVWTMDLKEEALDSGLENATTTGVGFSYKFGVMFQLNWLDQDSAKYGYKDSHIENTYLDVYITQNTSTHDENDPDTSSDFNWGAGLKIEF